MNVNDRYVDPEKPGRSCARRFRGPMGRGRAERDYIALKCDAEDRVTFSRAGVNIEPQGINYSNAALRRPWDIPVAISRHQVPPNPAAHVLRQRDIQPIAQCLDIA